MIDSHWKLKQLLIPILFAIVVINIPLVVHINTSPRPDPPPPGWSSIWMYYLHGDYDYFFRFRIMPQTLPFWVIFGIFLLQLAIPHRLEFKYDLLANLVLGIILTISWMLLIDYVYISNYTGTWEVNAFPFAPILALIVVPFYRIITRKNIESKESVTT